MAHIVLASYRAGAQGHALDADLTMACIYLVYKTLLIASRYPTYEDYRHLGNINDTFKEHVSLEKRRDLQHLVQKVIRDKSHVTFKISQVRNYIIWRKQDAQRNFGYMQYHLNEYAPDKLRAAKQTGKISEIIKVLPPSIFDFDIYLRKRGAANGIKLGELSSGERQLMYNNNKYKVA